MCVGGGCGCACQWPALSAPTQPTLSFHTGLYANPDTLISTPIFLPTLTLFSPLSSFVFPQGGVDLGRIASLEKDHKAVDVAKKGDTVAMKIEVGWQGSWWACSEGGWRVRGACWVAKHAGSGSGGRRCAQQSPALLRQLLGTAARLGSRGTAGKQGHSRLPCSTNVHRASSPPSLPPQATKPEEASRSYERHFDHTDELVSRIT